MKVKDILVPMDFSANALRALDFAVSIVDPSGEIYLLHAVDADFVEQVRDAGFADQDSAIGRMRATAEQRLGEVVQQRSATNVSIQTMIVVGKPFAEILRVATDLDFEMIVLGIHGRHEAIEELLFGSTAEKVLRGARVPVVCVPAQWQQETSG